MFDGSFALAHACLCVCAPVSAQTNVIWGRLPQLNLLRNMTLGNLRKSVDPARHDSSCVVYEKDDPAQIKAREWTSVSPSVCLLAWMWNFYCAHCRPRAVKSGLDMSNRMLLHLLLCDVHGRVRWRGNGLASPAELERLAAFTERLLQEAQEGFGAPQPKEAEGEAEAEGAPADTAPAEGTPVSGSGDREAKSS